MNQKSPGGAALLNLLLPGIGFAYIGGVGLTAFGLLMFALSLIDSILQGVALVNKGAASADLRGLAFGVAQALLLAGVGYCTAVLHNRSAAQDLPHQDGRHAAVRPAGAPASTLLPPSPSMGRPVEGGAFCHGCGAGLKAGARFCSACGVAVGE